MWRSVSPSNRYSQCRGYSPRQKYERRKGPECRGPSRDRLFSNTVAVPGTKSQSYRAWSSKETSASSKPCLPSHSPTSLLSQAGVIWSPRSSVQRTLRSLRSLRSFRNFLVNLRMNLQSIFGSSPSAAARDQPLHNYARASGALCNIWPN
jgi:hypothetical protein